MEAAGPLQGTQACFAPGQDLVALLYADGRYRTFDTAAGAVRLSSTAQASRLLPGGGGAAASAATCLCWLPQAAPGPGSRQSLVLGRADGSVQAVDAATGDVRWTTADCHEGPVGAVAAAPSGGSVCSVAADGQLRTVDAQNGAVEQAFPAGKGSLHALGISPDGSSVLVGGDALALYRLPAGKRLQKLSGHPTPVRSIAFAPGGRFAASAAQGDRVVVVWDLSAPRAKKADGKRHRQAAAGQLSADEPVHSLCLGPGPAPDSFQVAAILQSGRLHVWRCQPEGAASVQGSLLATAKPQGAGAAVLAAAFTSEAQLLVAHGSPSKPAMQHLSVPAAVPSSPVAWQLTAPEVTLVAGSKPKKQRQDPLLQPAAVDAAPMDAALASVQGGKRKRGPEQNAEPAANGLSKAGEEASESDEEGDEPTFAQRLEALGLPQGQVLEPQKPEALPKGSPAVQAGSLTTLLSQALQAQDSLALERCLMVTKAAVVTKTVRAMAPDEVLQLLSALTDRLQSRPVRSQGLHTWLRPLLLHHASYLTAAPGAPAELAKLYRCIQGQMVNQAALATLAGRLDLLCAQIPAASGRQDVVYEPQVVYDTAVDVEDALHPDVSDADVDDVEADASDAGELLSDSE